MSEQEYSQIGKDVKAIKRWWPAVAVILTTGYFLITTAMNATNTYDTKVAKKEDIAEIKASQQKMKEELKLYLLTVVNAKFDTLNTKIDGLFDKLNARIEDQNTQIRYIYQKCDKIGGYTSQGRYPGDEHPKFKPVPPSKIISSN